MQRNAMTGSRLSDQHVRRPITERLPSERILC